MTDGVIQYRTWKDCTSLLSTQVCVCTALWETLFHVIIGVMLC